MEMTRLGERDACLTDAVPRLIRNDRRELNAADVYQA